MPLIMKQLLIYILLFTVCSVGKSQNNLPYKPLSAFSNDTTVFALYSFMDRANFYRGKTVETVNSDLIKSIKNIYYGVKFNEGKIDGIYVYLYADERIHYLWENDKDDNIIEITFDKSEPETDKLLQLFRKDNFWDQNVYNYFKDHKVLEIKVLIPQSSKYYQKYYKKKKKGDKEIREYPIRNFKPMTLDDILKL